MPLTSFLHRKNNLPLPPLDPPPSVEKRQEKEKAWLASIYDRKGKEASSSSSSTNKDVRPVGFQHSAGKGKRSHVRSRTADSILTTTSAGKSNASVKSGLLTLSSRWRPSSRPASVVSSDGADAILQRDSDLLQVPQSAHPTPQHHQPAPAPATASTSSPSLAQRLEQLSQAHSQGLLDDEEYRVLRGSLFENSLKKPSLSPGGALAISQSVEQKELGVTRVQDNVQTTGTLLGLPRLMQDRYSMSALHSATSSSSNNDLILSEHPAQQHLLPVPSPADSVRSTRTRSKLSVRSSKSAISLRSRITSLLPASKQEQSSTSEEVIFSTTGPYVENDQMMAATTLKRKPSLIDSAISAMTFRAAAPTTAGHQGSSSRAAMPVEWTAEEGVHAVDPSRATASPSTASRRSSHLSVSGASSSSTSSSFRNMFQPMNSSTSASVSKAASSSLLSDENGSASTEYLKNSLASRDGLPNPRRSINEDNASRSLSTLSPLQPARSSKARDRSSTLLSSSSTQYPASPTSSIPHDIHLSFKVTRPEDELLDAAGLRKAIQKVELEKINVTAQFKQLEEDLLVSLGRSIRYSNSSSRQTASSPSKSMMAVGSPRGGGKRSLGSSSSSLLGGESTLRQSLNVVPPGGLSRRPDEAEDEELVLSLAMSPDKNGRRRLQGSSDSTESAEIEGDDKLRKLEEKRTKVEMRYDARLEYLQAKLVARELKEKLRR